MQSGTLILGVEALGDIYALMIARIAIQWKILQMTILNFRIYSPQALTQSLAFREIGMILGIAVRQSRSIIIQRMVIKWLGEIHME